MLLGIFLRYNAPSNIVDTSVINGISVGIAISAETVQEQPQMLLRIFLRRNAPSSIVDTSAKNGISVGVALLDVGPRSMGVVSELSVANPCGRPSSRCEAIEMRIRRGVTSSRFDVV
jgi:hypothetical protein